MKFATLKNQTRDGQFVVVNRAMTRCVAAPNIANTMQHVLDNWAHCAPLLEAIYQDLNQGVIEGMAFEASHCESPLPRAFHWRMAVLCESC
ncbi:fumarylacetoacetase [Vibrio ponticus]|nr:fumarylacetoacetase [Vibrio ponticus]